MLLFEFLSEISETVQGVGSRCTPPGNKQLQEQTKLGLVCLGRGKVSDKGTNLALGDRRVSLDADSGVGIKARLVWVSRCR